MALTRLGAAEQQIDDLKANLDDALGSEEMVVHLTERNLMLTEVAIHWFGLCCCCC